MSIPGYLLQQQPRRLTMEEDLRNMVKGRRCTICPTSHNTTGAILHLETQAVDPRQALPLRWPGYHVDCVQITYYTAPTETRLITKYYEAAELYRPLPDEANQHVVLRVIGSPTDGDDLQEQVLFFMQDVFKGSPPRNGFWITKAKRERSITILHISVFSDRTRFIMDMDLVRGGPPTYIQTTAEEIRASQSAPSFTTAFGTVHVTESEGSPEMAAVALEHAAARLLSGHR